MGEAFATFDIPSGYVMDRDEIQRIYGELETRPGPVRVVFQKQQTLNVFFESVSRKSVVSVNRTHTHTHTHTHTIMYTLYMFILVYTCIISMYRCHKKGIAFRCYSEDGIQSLTVQRVI